MKKILNFSPNYSRRTRTANKIKFVIIHYTGMQSEIASIKRLKSPRFKVSCHYLLNRRGEIIQMVKDKNIAWHAGKSHWKKFKNLNNNSIGIELVNRGHQYGYQNFSKKQIRSLIELCKNLKKKYSIRRENFLGHSDIAPLRKTDPGENFPWKKLSKHNLGKWYKRKKSYLIKINQNGIKKSFYKNLQKIGYRYFSIKKRRKTDKRIIKCFQQHYLPKHVTGKIDQKTYVISHFLAN